MSLTGTGSGVTSHRSRPRVWVATLLVALALLGAAAVTFEVRQALTDHRSAVCAGPPVTVTIGSLWRAHELMTQVVVTCAIWRADTRTQPGRGFLGLLNDHLVPPRLRRNHDPVKAQPPARTKFGQAQ